MVRNGGLEMYLIDTNIFLEVLLAQKRKKEAKKFLQYVSNGTLVAYFSRFSLYSIELLLTKLKMLNELATFLIAIKKFKGLRIISTTPTDNLLIVKITKNTSLDFEDALQYYLVKKYNLDGIISFDTDFDNTDINRFEPKDVINFI